MIFAPVCGAPSWTYRVDPDKWWNVISEGIFVEAEPTAGVFDGQFFAADDHPLWLCREDAFFLARPAA